MSNYSTILCATDFSDLASSAINRGIELARCYDASLILVNVIEYFPEDRSNDIIAPEDADPKSYRQHAIQEKLRDQAKELGCADAKQVVIISERSAQAEILDYVKENPVDLIVMGSHGLHGFKTLLGSTSTSVMHLAPCDVFLVHG